MRLRLFIGVFVGVLGVLGGSTAVRATGAVGGMGCKEWEIFDVENQVCIPIEDFSPIPSAEPTPVTVTEVTSEPTPTPAARAVGAAEAVTPRHYGDTSTAPWLPWMALAVLAVSASWAADRKMQRDSR